MTKCKNCQIGTYDHSSSEEAPLFENLLIDGMMTYNQIYRFCPWCGTSVSDKFKDIVKEQKSKILESVSRDLSMDNICHKLMNWAEKHGLILAFDDYWEDKDSIDEQWWAMREGRA